MKKKKIFVLLFILIIILFNGCSYSASDAPSVSSTAAILIDNKTNKILYSKNENEKMYPASTTKIITAILALEHCNLTDKVTASYDALSTIPDGYSTAGIQVNEVLTVEELLELLLVHSANDAANVLAEYIGGSIDSFMSMVNTKLNELGLENTHFTNPYGLHDTNHYTTAYDLAKIMQYCIENDTFRKLAGSASCAIPATNLSKSRLYSSTNELLDASSSNYYKYVTCGKTGYTSEAGECLVSVAYRDDLELICVVLGSEARFSDTVKLYEYGYSNFSLKKLFSKGDYVTQTEVSNATKDTRTLRLLSSDDIYALVDNSATTPDYTVDLSSTISAPIQEGDVLGTFSYNIDGTIISANLLAANDVERSQILTYILYIGIGFVAILIAFEVLRKNKN